MEKRTEVVRLRATPSEKKRWTASAVRENGAGATLSEYIREVLEYQEEDDDGEAPEATE